MRGRKPKPTAVKRLAGNPGKRALNGDEPRPRMLATRPPAHLSKDEKANKPGMIVMDLFAGSGTTLIACERKGRICRVMDNDPKFVAVCLERWTQMGRQAPELEGNDARP